ncbi:MAG: DUF1902 domain-containing protein [Rhizobiaceae bacterium]|nr:DUF1902 domain-containing protein [Rhizobiaceae bacterium]
MACFVHVLNWIPLGDCISRRSSCIDGDALPIGRIGLFVFALTSREVNGHMKIALAGDLYEGAVQAERMDTQYFVKAAWDDEAKVWYVEDTDVPGLATEAPTMDALLEKLVRMVPEMLELNGVAEPANSDIPFSFSTDVKAIAHC